jgi:integrase
MKMPKITTPRENIVDIYELVKILKTLSDEPKVRFAVAIAWETGARIGEIVQLRKKDFSEEPNFWLCSVPTEKQRTKRHGQQPKRLLKITKDPIYNKIIKPFLEKQEELDKSLIFPNTQSTLRKKLKRRYPDVYFHWLRHSRATIWSNKLDIFTLQYALGWQDIRMANIYVHQEQMSRKMGDMLLET